MEQRGEGPDGLHLPGRFELRQKGIIVGMEARRVTLRSASLEQRRAVGRRVLPFQRVGRRAARRPALPLQARGLAGCRAGCRSASEPAQLAFIDLFHRSP